MNINNAFPSKYLRSADIPEHEDLVLTISGVEIETLEKGEDSEDKPILYFDNNPKGLVLNKTNATTISHLYGPETDGWVGKSVALFATEVDFAGKQTLAIRVRMRAPKTNGAVPDVRTQLVTKYSEALLDSACSVHGAGVTFAAATDDLLKSIGAHLLKNPEGCEKCAVAVDDPFAGA